VGTSALAAAAPWWVKILAKLLLSVLPIAPGTWQRIGLFRHGAMDQPAYADGVFTSHWKRCGGPELRGTTVLELGPGDSIATAILAAAHGARAVLVDSGDYASQDLQVYLDLAERLSEQGLAAPDLDGVRTLPEILERCASSYLTEGLASLEGLPSDSIDLVFSQAVLEHVRRDEFDRTLQELARVLKGDGVASHRVDLRDHLGGSLNNLRLPSRLWERRWFAAAGFYTNRLSCSEILEVAGRSHRTVESRPKRHWDRPPLPRRLLAREFRDRTDDDLTIGVFDVVMRDPRPTLSAGGPRPR